MELVEIEVIGLEPLQRAIQFSIDILGQSLAGLACEKHLISIGLDGRAEAFLGVTVTGSHVEVVDAPVDGTSDILSGIGRGHILHDYAAKSDDRQSDSGAP